MNIGEPFSCQEWVKPKPRIYPALRYVSRSRKNELAGDFGCAFAFPFSAIGEPIIKLALAEVVPSDDPDHAVFSGAVRFALAASIDRAIASSIGRTCSDDLFLLFILFVPCPSTLRAVKVSAGTMPDFCHSNKKVTSNN